MISILFSPALNVLIPFPSTTAFSDSATPTIFILCVPSGTSISYIPLFVLLNSGDSEYGVAPTFAVNDSK